MRCPTLTELPPPPPGKTGWPWMEESEQLPDRMPDGEPWPKVSIVTPSYNQGQFIEETIRSVLLQGYPNLEYIIIDGGSTDNSVKVIQKYAPYLTYWISEPDRGQVHAINKGLAHATGEIFNWINSDDLLLPNALATIAQTCDNNDLVAGACASFEGETVKKATVCKNLTSSGLVWGAKFMQPAIWLRPKSIRDCDGIDPDLHYAFDWDLLIRYLHLFPKVGYTQSLLAHFRLHEGSKTVCEASMWRQEGIKILKKLLSLEQFESLHQTCGRRLREVYWRGLLEQMICDKNTPRWRRIGHIVLSSIKAPGIRWSRRTLGTIRHIWSN